jgi:uncharacterized protein
MGKKVLIGGGSGMIGARLTEWLLEADYEVCWMSREPEAGGIVREYKWDVSSGHVEEGALEGCHAVINLAGAGIADKRWTERRKRLIVESRTKTTRLLGKAMGGGSKLPSVFIGASAIGVYGNRPGEVLSEESDPGTRGFLPESVQQIEEAIKSEIPEGVRKVIPRFGMVLSSTGGALAQFLGPLKLGVASYMGSGDQTYSWVHIDDVCRFVIEAMKDESINGVYNVTAPEAVSSKEFGRILRKEWNKYSMLMPAPAFALRLLFGEMADAILDSARVIPARLEAEGFHFKFPKLEEALSDLKSTGH